MNPNSQKYGDRYGHGAPTKKDDNDLGKPKMSNSNPFFNPYEGQKVLMEGEEATLLNEHNVFAKSQQATANFSASAEDYESQKTDDSMKRVLILSFVMVVVIIIAILCVLFLGK